MNKLLDFREESLDNNFRLGTLLFLQRVLRQFGRMWVKKGREKAAYYLDNIHVVRDVRLKIIDEVINDLKEYAQTQERPEYVYAVQLEYEKMLKHLKRSGDHYDDNLEEKKEELRFKVLDAERHEIRKMYEAGEITAAQEKELRRFTNQIESIILFEHHE